MSIVEYINNIAFAFVQPDDLWDTSSLSHQHPLGRAVFEYDNTQLPAVDCLDRNALYRILSIPRMSTLPIAAIINKAVSIMPAKHSFVNIGIWHGFTFVAGMINNPDKLCIGIDHFLDFGKPRDAFFSRFVYYKTNNHSFYEMDYCEYFRHHCEAEIGVYLYDGKHDYNSQYNNLSLADPYLAEGALILVDDTNWYAPRRATLDFVAKRRKHYEILFDIGTSANQHPTFWNGLMILRRTHK